MTEFKSKFKIGDEVFLNIDPAKRKRFVIGVYFDANGTSYYLFDGKEGSYHNEVYVEPYQE